MTQPAPFKTTLAYPSAYNNSAVVAVTLSLLLPTGTPPGQLTLSFPPELGLSNANCPNCTVVPPSILYTVPSGTTSLALTVNNVQNVASFKPVSAINASLANANNYLSLFSSISAWTNTVPSSFVTTVSGSNNYKN